jgi:TetR/AcrR family transcriptional regulator
MAKRNPEKTRKNILEAAIQEFARAGFGGARVDRIAEEAGSNKRMIYHYFGSKDGLYQEVFGALYTEIREHELAIDLDETKPVEALVDLADRSFDFFLQRPEFIRIVNDENLTRAHATGDAGHRGQLTADLIDRIASLLKTGEEAGVIRSGLDAVQLYVSIAGLGYFYLSNAYTLGALFRRDLLAEDEVRARRAHIRGAVRAIVAA